MLEKDLVRGSLRDINKQQLAITGLLKKIRSNKSLSDDEVAQQAAKAVREESLSYKRLGLTGIFSDPRLQEQVLDVLQDRSRPQSDRW